MHGVSGRSLKDDEQGIRSRFCKRVHGCPLCQQSTNTFIIIIIIIIITIIIIWKFTAIEYNKQ